MTPQRLLVAAVVLLAGLAATSYLVLGTETADESSSIALGGPAGLSSTASAELAAESAELAAVGADGSARASRDEIPRATDAAAARELEVIVILPPDAPADPELEVVAIEARALEGEGIRQVLQRLRAARGPGGALARAAVGVNGRARLALPADVEDARVLLDGRFLFLDRAEPVRPDDLAVSLAPRVGACLVVRPIAPDAETPVGELALNGGDFSGRRRSDWRALEQGLGEGDVVFRGLDTANTWMLSAKLERHFAWPRLGVELEPGRETLLELELQRGATVAGVVVDEAGEPVADVTVAAQGGAPWMGGGAEETNTDGEGRFELVAVAPGDQRIEARSEGWRTARSDELELVEGQRLEGLRLVLERGMSLSGVVRYPDDRAGAGAEVVVETVTSGGGWGGWGGARRRRAGTATCDGEGRFALSGLDEGKLTVRASLAAAADDGDEAPLWHAQLDDVSAGAQDLTLTLAGPITFTGRVVDDAGQPVTAFRIEAESTAPGGPEEGQSFEDEEGRFTFARVGPGTWKLGVEADGHVQDEAPEVTLPGVAELEIVLLRAARVAGRVVDNGGSPVAGAEVRVDDGRGGDNPWAGQRGPRAESDDDGAFAFEELAPGALSLVAQAEGWADSTPYTLEIGPGEELADVALTLRVGARIEGVVSSPEGEPMAGRRVTWGDNPMGFGFRGEARTDAAGRFAFDAVTPGEWAVSASPSMAEIGERMRGRSDQGAWVEVMGELLTATVAVEEGEVAEVYLGGEPRRPVTVFGVVTRSGEPVAGARVFAVSEGTAVFQGMKAAETSSDGSYELVVDRPGAYVVSAQVDRAGIEELVDVPRAEETRVDLALPLGGIAGRVRLASGDPAVGVRVSIQRDDGMGRVRWGGDQGVTDADGRYSIESLEAGAYTVRANVAGWAGNSDEDWGSAVQSGVGVEADAITDGIDFRLEEAGNVAGIVTGADGRPLADAGVFFRDAAGRLVTSVASASTGANGRFTQDGLAPGEYTVSVRADGHAANDLETVRVRSAETSELRLAVETGVMALVQLEDREGKARRLRVEVFDGDDREVGGLITAQQLRKLFNEGSSTFERRVGPLPPGRYTVRATTPEGDVVERRVTLRARDEEKVVRLRVD